MLFGAAKKKWGPVKTAELHRRLQSVVMLPYDYRLCVIYGDLKAKLQNKGKPIADNDLWIAASSIRHSIPLISHNRRHFEVIPELVLIFARLPFSKQDWPDFRRGLELPG